jgi:hypothetical protein
MKLTHMSTWDQEEFALGQRTPEMMAHVEQCADCRASVTQLEEGIALFRGTAMAWSEKCLETRLQHAPDPAAARTSAASYVTMPALQWALAAVLLLLALVPVGFLAFHRSAQVAKQDHSVPVTTAAPLSDDALLQEVDQQVSEAVPDSMESLTHLVSTTAQGNAAGAKSVAESGQRAQTN